MKLKKILNIGKKMIEESFQYSRNGEHQKYKSWKDISQILVRKYSKVCDFDIRYLEKVLYNYSTYIDALAIVNHYRFDFDSDYLRNKKKYYKVKDYLYEVIGEIFGLGEPLREYYVMNILKNNKKMYRYYESLNSDYIFLLEEFISNRLAYYIEWNFLTEKMKK